MKVFEVLAYASKRLPLLDAEVLLSHVLKKTRYKFVSHPEFELTDLQFDEFERLCEKRKKGMPVAYLTHNKEFFGLDFHVDERVLIPRPETELLVESALDLFKNAVSAKFMDIGTGSGCIAIALAKKMKNSKILAADISKDALEVARMNCRKHKVEDQVELKETDLASDIDGADFDAIISNLPYIRVDSDDVEENVKKFEPHIALFGGENGLYYFEKLFKQLTVGEKFPGTLILEAGAGQKEGINGLIKKYFGKRKVSWKNDIAGIARVCLINFEK